MSGSTRLEDEWCPAARAIRAQVEGLLNMSAIEESYRRAEGRSVRQSTLGEDAHDPFLVRLRAQTGDAGAIKLMGPSRR